MQQAELIQLLDELRALPVETEWLEFKEAKNDYDFAKLGKYFSAIANEANLKGRDYGWLIFGVEDKQRTIVGSQYRRDRAKLESLKQEVANHTTGQLTFLEIFELDVDWATRGDAANSGCPARHADCLARLLLRS